MPTRVAAQEKIKVAAIYTVPVEQQWVSRIHKALNAAVARGDIEYKFSENVSNADYERVMRQYAEQGNTFIIGESFAVEAAARKVAKDYPKVSFLMGSSGKPQEPNLAVFDNYIQEPAYLTGMVAGGMAVDALLDVRKRVAPYLDLQLVAFPQDGLLRSEGAHDNLLRALDKGVDVVGGIPHFERSMAEGAESVRILCEIAAARGLRVDMAAGAERSDDEARRRRTRCRCGLRT